MILFNNISDFSNWLKDQKPNRSITRIQQHHTLIPSYADFDGYNHISLQEGMANYHVEKRGFSSIAQHFTTFNDGTIVTGRDLGKSPAGIKGANSGSICIEHLGNFDMGKDIMTQLHKDIIIAINAELCNRFGIEVNSDTILYHSWFDLKKGKRTNGSGTTKTCPGTSFFGGNRVEDAENNLYPQIRNKKMNISIPIIPTMSDTVELTPISIASTVLPVISPIAPVLLSGLDVVSISNDVKDVFFDNYDVALTQIIRRDPFEDSWASMPSGLEQSSIIIVVFIFIMTIIFGIRYSI